MVTIKKKVKSKGSKKGKPFTQDQIDEMLFWWVFCDENSNRTSKLITDRWDRNISRKVVNQVAIRENFHVKAPFVKVAVDEYRSVKTAGQVEVREASEIQLHEMGMNILEINYLLIKKAKEYITNTGRAESKFKSVKEVIDAMRYVEENILKLIGQENMVKDAFDSTDKIEGSKLRMSASKILKELPKREENEVLNRIEKKIIEGSIN